MTDRIRLLFRKDKEPYLCFYKMLGFYPRNIEVYQQALLHKSSSVKSDKGRLINNERLEFLGDAILDAVVADIVYKRFEGKREGFLTNTRSKIVQRDTLNRVAVQIGLDKLIKSATRQSSHNSYLCGNAFEALVGAIYLDRGYEACMKFMEERIIAPYLNLEKVSRKEVNFKSKLIEWSQKNKFQITFELAGQSVDEEQNLVFTTQVMVESLKAGSGKGYSKKESQQEAARETLQLIKNDPKFIDAIFAVKAEREQLAEPVQEAQPAVAAVLTATLQEVKQQELKPDADETHEADPDDEPMQRYGDMERIIAEAEEAAFSRHAAQE
ncbi:MAG: ribonuclease III [Phocaeicola plebeius]|nr:ribonuclease III [Phocaeicola plebeius]